MNCSIALNVNETEQKILLKEERWRNTSCVFVIVVVTAVVNDDDNFDLMRRSLKSCYRFFQIANPWIVRSFPHQINGPTGLSIRIFPCCSFALAFLVITRKISKGSGEMRRRIYFCVCISPIGTDLSRRKWVISFEKRWKLHTHSSSSASQFSKVKKLYGLIYLSALLRLSIFMKQIILLCKLLIWFLHACIRSARLTKWICVLFVWSTDEQMKQIVSLRFFTKKGWDHPAAFEVKYNLSIWIWVPINDYYMFQ